MGKRVLPRVNMNPLLREPIIRPRVAPELQSGEYSARNQGLRRAVRVRNDYDAHPIVDPQARPAPGHRNPGTPTKRKGWDWGDPPLESLVPEAVGPLVEAAEAAFVLGGEEGLLRLVVERDEPMPCGACRGRGERHQSPQGRKTPWALWDCSVCGGSGVIQVEGAFFDLSVLRGGDVVEPASLNPAPNCRSALVGYRAPKTFLDSDFATLELRLAAESGLVQFADGQVGGFTMPTPFDPTPEFESEPESEHDEDPPKRAGRGQR